MKANKIRFLAGGLAAALLMSNMATNVVFAEELEAPVAVEESAPAVESTPAPAEESAPAEENAPVVESTPAPAPEYAEPEVMTVPDPAPTPAEEVVPVQTDEPVQTPAEEVVPEQTGEPEAQEAAAAPAEVEAAHAAAVEETVPAVAEEETAPVSEETVPDEVGTAKAGNFEDNLYGEGTAHAGNCEETVAAEADTQEVEEEVTVVRSSEMNILGPKWNNGERTNTFKSIVTEYSNGEKVERYQTLDLEGNVVKEEIYRLTTGKRQLLETGDLNELRAYAQADRINEENAKQTQALYEQYKEKYDSIDKFMEDFTKQGNAFDNADSNEAEGQTPGSEDASEDYSVKYSKAIIKSAADKFIDDMIEKLPGSDYVGDNLKKVIKGTLGIADEEEDAADLLEKSTRELKDTMDEYHGKNERLRQTVSSIVNFGNRLDKFTSAIKMVTDEIGKLSEDVKNGTISQTAMDVRVAALVGNLTEIRAGEENVFTLMESVAQTMRTGSGNGPDTDMKNRNLFDLFYDYYKEESAFSGEAMDKANKSIQLRLNRYLKDCRALLGVLGYQQKVADLSEEEINSLDEDTKEIYRNTVTGSYDIGRFVKSILYSITGNKESDNLEEQAGILDRSREYYSKKRNTFIDVNGQNISEIKLSDKLGTVNSENFDLDTLRNASALNERQIKRIAEQAKKNGMTVLQYLKKMGFDVSALEKSKRTVFLSTLQESYESPFDQRGRGDYFWRYKGINMNKKGAGEESKSYYHYYKHTYIWESDEKDSYSDGLLVVFRK